MTITKCNGLYPQWASLSRALLATVHLLIMSLKLSFGQYHCLEFDMQLSNLPCGSCFLSPLCLSHLPEIVFCVPTPAADWSEPSTPSKQHGCNWNFYQRQSASLDHLDVVIFDCNLLSFMTCCKYMGDLSQETKTTASRSMTWIKRAVNRTLTVITKCFHICPFSEQL